jgi:hypothetical protein
MGKLAGTVVVAILAVRRRRWPRGARFTSRRAGFHAGRGVWRSAATSAAVPSATRSRCLARLLATLGVCGHSGGLRAREEQPLRRPLGPDLSGWHAGGYSITGRCAGGNVGRDGSSACSVDDQALSWAWLGQRRRPEPGPQAGSAVSGPGLLTEDNTERFRELATVTGSLPEALRTRIRTGRARVLADAGRRE